MHESLARAITPGVEAVIDPSLHTGWASTLGDFPSPEALVRATVREQLSSNPQVSPKWASNVAVIGTGAYGTAIQHRLAASGVCDVIGWGRDEATVAQINGNRTNARYLPGSLLSENVKATTDLDEALFDRGIIILALPSNALPHVLSKIRPHPDTLVISLAKGFIFDGWDPLKQPETLGLGPPPGAQVFTPLENLKRLEGWKDLTNVAVAAGPGFAGEIARGRYFGLTVAAQNEQTQRRAYYALRGTGADIEVWQDPIGVEMYAAMKNIIAVAVGLVEGLKNEDGTAAYGSGERVALMKMGMRETLSLVKAAGGRSKTQQLWNGWPDLVLTTSKNDSRNKSVGLALAEGKTIVEVLESERCRTAEGPAAAYAVKLRSDPDPASGRPGIHMPVVNHLIDGFQGRAPWSTIFDDLFRVEKNRNSGLDIPDPFSIQHFPLDPVS